MGILCFFLLLLMMMSHTLLIQAAGYHLVSAGTGQDYADMCDAAGTYGSTPLYNVGAGEAEPYYALDSESHAVRCCSDTYVDGWRENTCEDGTTMWAASSAVGCASGTYAEAEELCLSSGGRLCTLDEIYNRCTQGSGCLYDCYYTWTSSSDYHMVSAGWGKDYSGKCDDGGYPDAPLEDVGAGEAEPYFASDSESHAVRCCSDTSVDGWRENTCNDGTTMWAASKYLGCVSTTYAGAEELCLSSGGRLCTLDEVYNGCTRSSGCDFDCYYIWTSSTGIPTEAPSVSPSASPTASPTQAPTQTPTASPTSSPTASPTKAPTESPTSAPTRSPTQSPTSAPTQSPTSAPTESPTSAPTRSPTSAPTRSPTGTPTQSPTSAPTKSPTSAPTQSPTGAPTQSPTGAPTQSPTVSPTNEPTQRPTVSPTNAPTPSPTSAPTQSPTASHTMSPTASLTHAPSQSPSQIPREATTEGVTLMPSSEPTLSEPTSSEPTNALPPPLPTLEPYLPSVECPEEYTLTGSLCLKAVDKAKAIKTAKALCASEGATLASIHSSVEQIAVTTYLSKFIAEHPDMSFTDFWLGLEVQDQTETYSWADGGAYDFKNWLPTTDVADGCAIVMGQMDSVGYWESASCDEKHNVLCSFEANSEDEHSYDYSYSFEFKDEDCFTCEEGFSLYGDMCLQSFTDQPKTMENAEESCQGFGGHLLGIHSDLEESFVIDYLSDLMFLNPQLADEMKFWIGLTLEDEEVYSWTDGGSDNYVNFLKHSPGRNKDCTIITAGTCVEHLGNWNVRHCDAVFPYICYVEATDICTKETLTSMATEEIMNSNLDVFKNEIELLAFSLKKEQTGTKLRANPLASLEEKKKTDTIELNPKEARPWNTTALTASVLLLGLYAIKNSFSSRRRRELYMQI